MKPIMLLGEARGANEDKIKSSFVGASGVELLRMLSESGIVDLSSSDQEYISRYYTTGDPNMLDMVWRLHPEVYRTNVFQQHPPGNKIEAFCGGKDTALPGYPKFLKGKYVRAEYAHELTRLGDEILVHDPNLIICFGNSALWALTGQTGVSKLRGTTTTSTHTVSGYKLISTYHPAAVIRQWELRPTTVMDLVKAKREAEFPEVRRPKREIWIEPSIGDINEFRDRFISGCSCLSVDIETARNQITCIGFSPSANVAIVIPISDIRRKDGNYWQSADDEREVWKLIREILADRSIKKLFQNGLYDVAFLWRAYGIKVFGAEHDTMLAHHALQPESLKSLGFLGSIYSNESAWKTERKKSETIKRDE